jgi:hypothetical protein
MKKNEIQKFRGYLIIDINKERRYQIQTGERKEIWKGFGITPRRLTVVGFLALTYFSILN